MRSLQRNWREISYIAPISTESIVDEYGNDTLEMKTVYSDPVTLRVNVSANAGQEAVEVFGALTDYSRTITYCGTECPLFEGCLVTFANRTYSVIKVADSKNGFLIALREVTDRG